MLTDAREYVSRVLGQTAIIDLIEGKGWRWHQHPWKAGVRYVRLRATSPTYGQVTVVIVDEPSQDRFYPVCLETERSAPQWFPLLGRLPETRTHRPRAALAIANRSSWKVQCMVLT